MGIHFIDNYPKNNLESKICKQDGSPLFGEIWLYKELLKFNDNNFLKDETWYVKHNYNLSSHPFSAGKVEGQIDYLIINKYGVLIIELKGGGIEVDANDVYYSYDGMDKSRRYQAQNPFNQVKEYVHSLKSLIDSNPFIFRAVIFPHEIKFELQGPQLSGYKYLFFSKKDLDKKETDFGKNEALFQFLISLSKEARKHILKQLHPNFSKQDLEEGAWKRFPLINKKEIERIKLELLPVQSTYGFDPQRIFDEIILEENYEILKGLRKNRRVMVQGAPGTGKTVLATKFIAESLIKQQKGIFFCANRLLRSKLEYRIVNEYKLDPNMIKFEIYHEGMTLSKLNTDIDFVIVDEAQEFFDKGLYDFLQIVERDLTRPRILVLYDPDQAIVQNYKDIDWYADFLLESSFVHYHFDTNWRCTQNQDIVLISELIKSGEYKKVLGKYPGYFEYISDEPNRLRIIKEIIDCSVETRANYMILVESNIFVEFKKMADRYFPNDLQELLDSNINIKNKSIRFTTPIMFRGLESENVVLVTTGINDQTKIQNYIGITRAICNLKCIIWK